jgi:hypothetical protein
MRVELYGSLAIQRTMKILARANAGLTAPNLF